MLSIFSLLFSTFQSGNRLSLSLCNELNLDIYISTDIFFLLNLAYKFMQKEAQFVAIAVQLHQTLSEVRRIPVIKILPPGGDANPWAIVPVK